MSPAVRHYQVYCAINAAIQQAQADAREKQKQEQTRGGEKKDVKP